MAPSVHALKWYSQGFYDVFETTVGCYVKKRKDCRKIILQNALENLPYKYLSSQSSLKIVEN